MYIREHREFDFNYCMPCNYLCFGERERTKESYVVINNSIYPNTSYHVLVVTYNSIYLILEMHPKLRSQGSTIVTVPEEEHFQEHDKVIGQCVILHQIINLIETKYHF